MLGSATFSVRAAPRAVERRHYLLELALPVAEILTLTSRAVRLALAQPAPPAPLDVWVHGAGLAEPVVRADA